MGILGGTYLIGGTLTQNCFLAIHEITHGLAFKSVKANRLLAMVANLPIAIPYSAKFPGYHMWNTTDTRAPTASTQIFRTPIEAWLFHNGGIPAKIFFLFNQILFYAIRPNFVRDQAVDAWFVLNFVVQIAFDVAVVKAFGMGPIWYFLMSAFLQVPYTRSRRTSSQSITCSSGIRRHTRTMGGSTALLSMSGTTTSTTTSPTSPGTSCRRCERLPADFMTIYPTTGVGPRCSTSLS